MEPYERHRRHVGRFLQRVILALVALSLVAPLSAETRVVAWGLNESGQSTVPPGLVDATSVAAGRDHALALRADGTVVAWGAGVGGSTPTNVPAGLNQVVAISAGYGHSLALRSDGTVVSWRPNGTVTRDVPANLTNAIAVSGGGGHSLALRADRTVAAWVNSTGTNGVPAEPTQVVAVPPRLTNVIAISTGLSHSLALTAEGFVVAWGQNQYGQATVPAFLTDAVAVASGYHHNLALRRDGTVFGWGWNLHGQLDVPGGLRDVIAIAAGGFHSLALRRDGTLIGWGSPGTSQSRIPSGLTNIVRLAGGGYNTIALLGDGTLQFANDLVDRIAYSGSTITLDGRAVGAPNPSQQWRFNGDDLPGATNALLILTNVNLSQAGEYRVTARTPEGLPANQAVRLQVVDSPPLVLGQQQDVVASLGSRLLLRGIAQGSQPMSYQWRFEDTPLAHATNANLLLQNVAPSNAGFFTLVASNAFGITTSDDVRVTPVPIVGWGTPGAEALQLLPDHTNAVALAAGSFGMALASDGKVLAWGADSRGQTSVPASLSNAVAMAPGQWFGLAVTAAGSVVHWGDSIGPLPPDLTNVLTVSAGSKHALALRADGSVQAFGSPTFRTLTNVPPDLGPVVAVACGHNHNVILTAHGTVLAWGPNSSGQTNVPSELTQVVGISAGGRHSLALRSNGEVVAWGANDEGQSTVPPDLVDVIAIAAGSDHSMALKRDRSVASWGSNSGGQSVPPSYLSHVVQLVGGSGYSLALVDYDVLPAEVRLQDPRIDAGMFSVSILTRRGKTYWLEAKDSLSAPWHLLHGAAGNGSRVDLIDRTVSNGARFYRMIQR